MSNDHLQKYLIIWGVGLLFVKFKVVLAEHIFLGWEDEVLNSMICPKAWNKR